VANPLFQARFEVTGVEQVDVSTWQMTGEVIDSSGTGFGPADAEVGNLVFDEDVSIFIGTVNCWKVTELVAVGPSRTLVVKVQYAEPGSPGGMGEPQSGSCAICKSVGVTPLNLSQTPAQGWVQIGETLQNGVRNYDMRTVAGVGAQGSQGISGCCG